MKTKPGAVARGLPKRPEWTSPFRAKPVKRAIDYVAVYVINGEIRLVYSRNNKPVSTKSFFATDTGVKAFVDYVIQPQITDRLSVNLAHPKITPQALADLEQLDNLAFVGLADFMRHWRAQQNLVKIAIVVIEI